MLEPMQKTTEDFQKMGKETTTTRCFVLTAR